MGKFLKKIPTEVVPYQPGMEDGIDYDLFEPDGSLYLTFTHEENRHNPGNTFIDDMREQGYTIVPKPFINTLEGKHTFQTNAWIATGVNGERWAIDREIFFKTYRPTDNESQKAWDSVYGGRIW